MVGGHDTLHAGYGFPDEVDYSALLNAERTEGVGWDGDLDHRLLTILARMAVHWREGTLLTADALARGPMPCPT